ncbi:hypothetical protein JL720_4698 [Aureococcus anophagefferens]|nr:hypothetical protein JL720_4698 [Aureococcus anophagefferens]
MGVTVDKHGARRQLASMGTVNLTPGDNLPQARRVTGALRMISVDVHAERARAERLERSRARLTRSVAPVVDGFLLLEACGVEFPDEGHRADVSGYAASSVSETDLEYFPRLATLDCSDNCLPLAPFGKLPRLKELRFAANGLERFDWPQGSSAWQRLQVLDLSYNALGVQAVTNLAGMPQLRELDLTGNGLRSLPTHEEFGKFPALERLSLERNKLGGDAQDDCGNVCALSGLTRLRELSLAHNKLTGFPTLDAVAEATKVSETAIFVELVALNLAWNKIHTEGDVMGLTLLPKLEHLALYGNPLLGPAKEDASGGSVRNFAECAADARDGWTDRLLEVSTEVPRRRAPRGSMAAATNARGDRRFRNVSLTRPISRSGTWDSNRGVGDFYPPPAPATAGQPSTRGPTAGVADDGMFLTALDDVDDLSRAEAEEILAEHGDDDPLVRPSTLMARAIEPDRRSDPGKLRAALNALKFALDHPAYLNRKLPRRPYQLKEKPGESALRDADAAKRRAANVMQTNALHEIGSVLDQMNHNVLQAATEFDDDESQGTLTSLK